MNVMSNVVCVSVFVRLNCLETVIVDSSILICLFVCFDGYSNGVETSIISKCGHLT